MRLSLFIPLAVLSGCTTVTITGDWSGNMNCDNETQVAIELDMNEPNDSLSYTGNFFFQTFSEVSNSQGVYDLEANWQGGLSASQPEPEGVQDISFNLSLGRDVECFYYQFDELISEKCYFNGLSIGYEFVSEHDGDWDGLNTMGFGNLNCSGDIERDDPIEE